MRPVVWSEDALRDYFDILRYIEDDNPIAAERIVDAIATAADDLGKRATGRPGRVSGTCEKSVSRLPYVIAYALTERAGAEGILILRVIHTNGLKLRLHDQVCWDQVCWRGWGGFRALARPLHRVPRSPSPSFA